MIFLKLAGGILFFFLGWVYLYRPNRVLEINRIGRELLFNDRRILLERRKLAMLFFCFSFVGLFMGLSSLTQWQKQRSEAALQHAGKYTLYLAVQDYYDGRYSEALKKYQSFLKEYPNHKAALRMMARTYSALGEKKKAKAIFSRLAHQFPKDEDIRQEMEQLSK